MRTILIFRTKESILGIREVQCNVEGFPTQIPIGESFKMKIFMRNTDWATVVERTWQEGFGVVITCEVSRFLLKDLNEKSKPIRGTVDVYQLPSYTWSWGD